MGSHPSVAKTCFPTVLINCSPDLFSFFWLGGRHKVEAVGRCVQTQFMPVCGRKGLSNFRFCSSAYEGQCQGPYHGFDLMMPKTACMGLDNN